MIELNWTFVVQIINFLILMFILNKILYKPILKVLDERDAEIVGGQQKNKQMIEDAEKLLKEYSERMQVAKLDALSVKNSAHKEAVEQANVIIRESRENAEEIIFQVSREMEQEIEKAKKDLEPELGSMAETIAQQLLGRKVA
ncbi:MAG: ATP synthase F0 subunit B [Deltaproteobacteria bacterium]|nr:ATP synthase F0 subunit B [Deltaproteobacteria bacterium]